MLHHFSAMIICQDHPNDFSPENSKTITCPKVVVSFYWLLPGASQTALYWASSPDSDVVVGWETHAVSAVDCEPCRVAYQVLVMHAAWMVD